MTDPTWTELLGRAERAGLLPDPELDDPDDPMTVDLAGKCSICGADVDAESGVCANGHDDVDRADAGRWVAWLHAAIAKIEADVAALIAAAAD